MSTTACTIHVSISIDNEEEPIEFNFLSEKLDWDNLVNLIQTATTLIEVPVILYFKKEEGSAIESLENQEQLETLLSSSSNIKGLRFYGQKNSVNETVYVLPGNAFIRLGQLVDQHKQTIASSSRLARWIGILASFIAQDITDHDFDYEFKVLEKLIERKINKRSDRRQGEETDCANEEGQQDEEEAEEDQDPREALFSRGGPFGGRGFFGRGSHRHGGRGGRGGHHHRGSDPREAMFGRASPCGGRGFFGGRGGHGGEFGGRGGHHGPFGKHGHHADFFDAREGPFGGRGDLSEEFGGRHGPFGGRGGRHHGSRGGCHHGGEDFFGRRGGKHGFDSENFSGDEKLGCGGKKQHNRYHHPYGRGFSSSEESSTEDDIRTLRMHLLKKHLKHGKGFKRHENHFHFSA